MTGNASPTVSLVVTVRNEERAIPILFDSIRAQTQRPDEVIVIDGGSTDQTLAQIRERSEGLPVTVISAPGANISQGRNLGLRSATSEIVAVTDAGVRLDPGWLTAITAPFRRDPRAQPDVVSGFFRPEATTLFELTLGATTLPDQEDIDPARFLPSSRSVAFRRSLYQGGFQYPAWLDYGEDLVFDLRLRQAGTRFEFCPQAFVWFRPRSTLGAYWRQYFLYARGDGKSGLFARRHLIRYVTYGLGVPVIGRLVSRERRAVWLALGLGLLYMRMPFVRLVRRRSNQPATHLLAALLLAPFLRLVGDLAKMAGYPVGLIWRIRRFGPRSSWRTISEPRG